VQPSQVKRAELSRARRAGRESAPGEVYSVAACRRAIARACECAGVETWAPAQLRHNAAEKMRREFGVEIARCVLGHADVRTTQLYSSFDVPRRRMRRRSSGRLGSWKVTE
jgi:integrase